VFLNATLERNPSLIQAALAFHRGGLIPPNCFLVDLDAVTANASLLGQAALAHGLSLYFTTKQIGFNPLLARSIVQAGIPKAIAIDVQEAAVLAQAGVPIGHVGHLVQIPAQMIGAILRLEPEVVTIYCVDKACQISEWAVRAGRQVQLLLRVVAEGDFLFPGQEGGFRLERLLDEAAAVLRLPNVRIVGVTSYPCLELDRDAQTLHPTHNFHTILAAARRLQDELGVRVEQINAPGNTCVAAMEVLARMGATHGEPGHALTGTTYLHAHSRQPENPAMVYVTEISHLEGNQAYAFGGGTYRRAQDNNALVGLGPDRWTRTRVVPFNPTAIDYYIALDLPPDHTVRVGDSVLLASRAQVFVSRSFVAVARGIQDGHPVLAGLFDCRGRGVEPLMGSL
jgi:predicted amino acid racemase